jgi:hypothetical protein
MKAEGFLYIVRFLHFYWPGQVSVVWISTVSENCPHEQMGRGSFPFGESRKVERGNGHCCRNIEGFYVAAEGDGKSSGGLLADES